MKIVDGGYVPLLLAAAVYGVMLIWHRGTVAVAHSLEQAPVPVAEFLDDIDKRGVPRVPGTAVFLTRTTGGVPPVLLWHLRQNRALHECVVVLRVVTELKPRVQWPELMTVAREGDRFWRVTAHFGFMQRPDIPHLLQESRQQGCEVQLDDVTYYVGHEIIVHRERGAVLPVWQEKLFAAMARNATHVTDYFQLPSEQVVEIGRQFSI